MVQKKRSKQAQAFEHIWDRICEGAVLLIQIYRIGLEFKLPMLTVAQDQGLIKLLAETTAS